MNKDAAILARAILPLMGKCGECQCGGDECSMPEGGRCWWMNTLKTLCSNPRCQKAAASKKKKRQREDQRNERRSANAMPTWMRLRREQQKPKKRKMRKVKGRAA